MNIRPSAAAALTNLGQAARVLNTTERRNIDIRGDATSRDVPRTLGDRIADCCDTIANSLVSALLGMSMGLTLVFLLKRAGTAGPDLRSPLIQGPISASQLDAPAAVLTSSGQVPLSAPKVASNQPLFEPEPTANGLLACFSERRHWDGLEGDFESIEKPSVAGQVCGLYNIDASTGAPTTDFFARSAVPCLTVPGVRFRPSECSLPVFDPAATLRALRGRTLYMMGDSVMGHQHDALQCLLAVRRRSLGPPAAAAAAAAAAGRTIVRRAASESVSHEGQDQNCQNWDWDDPKCPGWGPIDPAPQRSALSGGGSCVADCRIYHVRENENDSADAGGSSSPLGGVGYGDANWARWRGNSKALWADKTARTTVARTCHIAIGRFGLMDATRTPCFRQMTGNDVILVNIGKEFNNPDTLETELLRFLSFWGKSAVEEGPGALPHLLWRGFRATPLCSTTTISSRHHLFLRQESTAQHFAGPGGGQFRNLDAGGGCAEVPFEEASGLEFRNNRTRPHLVQAGVPVLSAWAATQRLGTAQHPPGHIPACKEARCRQRAESASMDCTHFCAGPGGVMEALNAVVAGALRNIERAPRPAKPG